MNENLTAKEKECGKWFTLHKKLDEDVFSFFSRKHDLEEFKCIHAPKDYFYADPFCVKHDNLYYVFFELFDYHWGKIAYYTIDDNMVVSDIKPINIDINNHTSFPYIFKDNNTWYMIPETAHLGKINLYECTSFPDKWKLKKTLFDNVHAADNTIVKHDGLYWLFSLFYVNREHYFRIFYSENLTGEWKEHKLVNQAYGLTNNTKLTRGAGNIIKINDKLIRPAQYSEKGINGEAVILYEIEKLTPDEYIENPIKIISRNNLPSIRAIHTLSLCDDMLTMDARLERNHDQEFRIEENKDMQEIIEKNHYVDQELLEKAFSYNTSGNGKCYYSATINGRKYEGERNWDERWSLLKDCMDFNDKNVLDIGCNMGIFLTYLKRFRNIKNAVGIDEPDELLKSSNKSETINSAKLLSSGFGVDVSFKQIDLNKENYEEIIGYNFDIVIAMSIYKWISDKDRFLKYLSNFNNILYEGHDSDEEEINRFSQFGYSYKIIGKTQTGLSYDKNNTRTVILFYK